MIHSIWIHMYHTWFGAAGRPIYAGLQQFDALLLALGGGSFFSPPLARPSKDLVSSKYV